MAINKSQVILICAVSVIFSIIGTLRVYPFIGLADGFSRWQLALQLVNNGEISSETLLSPAISVIQAATYYISQSFGLYTVLQGFLFYSAALLMFYYLIGNIKIRTVPVWIAAGSAVLLLPTFRIFPLMLTDSAPVFTILAFILCMNTYRTGKYSAGGVCIIIFLISVCIAIRINSALLFIFAALYLFFRFKNKFLFLTVIFSIILGCWIPKLMVPNHSNAASLGMVWELVSLEKETSDQKLYSDLAEFGNVPEAVKRWRPDYLNNIVWDDNPPFSVWNISKPQTAKKISKVYIGSMQDMPWAFLKNKSAFVFRTLGITSPLITSARGVHGVDEHTLPYGALATPVQASDRAWFIKFTDSIGMLTLRPWVMILLFGILLICGRAVQLDVSNFISVYLVGIFYYLSFCLNTQAMEFRYYAPTFFMLFIGSACLLIAISGNAILVWKRKGRMAVIKHV